MLSHPLRSKSNLQFRMTNERPSWMVNFAQRKYPHYVDIPHIPIPVEDLPAYTSLRNFDKCVTTVQTIGEIIPRTETTAMLLSLTPGNDTQFPLSMKNLSINEIYEHKNDTWSVRWDTYNPTYKVYGTLYQEDGDKDIVLDVTYLIKAKDPVGSWKTIMTLSKLTFREHEQYLGIS